MAKDLGDTAKWLQHLVRTPWVQVSCHISNFILSLDIDSCILFLASLDIDSFMKDG